MPQKMDSQPDPRELQPDPRVLAQLSALADGTLEAEQRASVQARIESSPELQALYERERRIVEALHQARASDRAPARLRARIEAQRPRPREALRHRAGYGVALGGVLAAAAIVLALALPSGTPGSPSLSQAAALAARGPSHPAPTADPKDPQIKLLEAVGDVYFPNWSPRFGWRAVGERVDALGDRRAVTVYYQGDGGRRIAYTVLDIPPLAQPAAPVTNLNGVQLRTLTLNGRLVVTWRRYGHTCVLSGSGVSARVLRELAAWKVPGHLR